MPSPEEDSYSMIFASLKHPIRRRILRILSNEPQTFSDLLKEFKIESSHLTYHIDGLGNLLFKTEDGKYALSSLGEAAVSIMKNVEEPPTPLRFRPITKARVSIQEQPAKPWLVGLIALATIYLTIIISVAVLKIWTDPSVWPSAIVLLSFLFVAYSIYVAHDKKRIIDLTISLCVVGMLFIIIGAVVLVPYTTLETFKTETSQDVTHGIRLLGDSSVQPIHSNGSLVLISLPSNASKVFFYDGVIFPNNASIFQIEISDSDWLNFVMKSFRPETDEIFLNETFDTGSYRGGIAGEYWVTFFWTPLGSFAVYSLSFNFTNPNSHDVDFYFRVTDFYLKATGESAVTNYKTWGDPNLPYVGLLMIGVAVTFNVYSLRKSKDASSEK